MTCSAGPLSPALSDNEHAVSLPKPDTDSVVLVRYIYMPCHGTSGSSDRVPPPHARLPAKHGVYRQTFEQLVAGGQKTKGGVFAFVKPAIVKS